MYIKIALIYNPFLDSNFLFYLSIRVSNELGAGHPEAARLAVHVILVMVIAEGLLMGIVIVLIRKIWGYAYSNATEVVEYIAKMMPILAASNFVDGIQSVLSGFYTKRLSYSLLLLIFITGF